MSITTLQKLELIARARKLVDAEYTQSRDNEYNVWRDSHLNAWKGGNIIVPYPPFVINPAFTKYQFNTPKPTEQDVCDKALQLFNELEAQFETPVVEKLVLETEPIVEAVINPVIEIEEVIPEILETLVEEVIAETVEEAVEEIVEELVEEIPIPLIEEALEEEPIAPEPIIEEAIMPEQEVIQPPAAPISTHADEIRKIFAVPVGAAEASVEPVPKPVVEPATIQEFVQTIQKAPPPAEVLKQASSMGRILPNVLRKLQDMAAARLDNSRKSI